MSEQVMETDGFPESGFAFRFNRDIRVRVLDVNGNKQ